MSKRKVTSTIEEVISTTQVTELSLVCDKCQDTFLVYKKNKLISERPISNDWISLTITIPTLTLRRREATRDYCPRCWDEIKKDLNIES